MGSVAQVPLCHPAPVFACEEFLTLQNCLALSTVVHATADAFKSSVPHAQLLLRM